MKRRAYFEIAFCILALSVTPVISQSQDDSTFINLIIGVDLSPNLTQEQILDASQNIANIFFATTKKDLDWSLFATKDSLMQVSNYIAGQIVLAPPERMIEVGLFGNQFNEKLSTKSYSDQKELLKEGKEFAEATQICGVNEVKVMGFAPQSFDQNEDTYKVLDDLEFEYDAGFQAGISNMPGHEEDVWPYKVEEHKFYAVPISTYMLSGKLVPLYDQYAKDNGITSSQWKDALVGKLNEISGKDEPLVIMLTTSISGSGDYLDALNEFRDFALSNNAVFVTTQDLVDMSRKGIHQTPERLTGITPEADASAECTTCNKDQNVSLNATPSNETVMLL